MVNVPSRTRLIACVLLLVGCGQGSDTTLTKRVIDGEWFFNVSASPSCLDSLPFGFGVAPRGGGQATLTQNGDRFSGQLAIFGTPAGTIDGTITDGVVRFTVNLDGRNVGVLSPAHEPCRVTGVAAGETNYSCWISGRLDGELACPFSCMSESHFIMLRRCDS
jgi:hypothetical protein